MALGNIWIDTEEWHWEFVGDVASHTTISNTKPKPYKWTPDEASALGLPQVSCIHPSGNGECLNKQQTFSGFQSAQITKIEKSRVKLNVKAKPFQLCSNLNQYNVSVPEVSLTKIDPSKLNDDRSDKSANPIFRLVQKTLYSDADSDLKQTCSQGLVALLNARTRSSTSNLLPRIQFKYSVQSLLDIYKNLSDFSSNLLGEEPVKSDFVLKPMINETKQNLAYDMHHLFNLGPPVNLTSIL